MAQREGELIVQAVIEEPTTPPKALMTFVEEWIHILPGSTNAQNANDIAFKDPYEMCRDVVVPDRNGYELFWFFYKNKVKEVPICNPWVRNLGKLIMLEVFVDMDLVKELIKCYNPINKSFYRKDKSVLLALDKDIFIETFNLGGPMSLPIDIEELNENFKKHKSFYMGKNLTRHIPKVKKDVGEIPKKRDVDKSMPLDLFQRYFQNTGFGIDKALGSDGTMNALGAYYCMALNIQDPNHYVGYYFVE